MGGDGEDRSAQGVAWWRRWCFFFGVADAQASRCNKPVVGPLLTMAVVCSVHGVGLSGGGLVRFVVHHGIAVGRGAGLVVRPAI